MDALGKRRSSRDFARDALRLPLLSGLLWAADGVNRTDGGRTAPSASNAQEIEVFVALPSGAYRYHGATHALYLVAASDLRRVTGYQDFVDEAPLDLVYVADHARMGLVPVAQRESHAAIADALGLNHDQQVLLSQTVGYPKPDRRASATG
jgi:nitroreductase